MANKKYNEDQILDEISQYIDGTYNQHYVGIDEIQTLDVWESLGIADSMCVGTAIKYLMRFGKKEGRNRKDILKSIHFLVLLLHYEDKRKQLDALRADNAKKLLDEKFPKEPQEAEKEEEINYHDVYREVAKDASGLVDWIISHPRFVSVIMDNWDDTQAPDVKFEFDRSSFDKSGKSGKSGPTSQGARRIK